MNFAKYLLPLALGGALAAQGDPGPAPAQVFDRELILDAAQLSQLYRRAITPLKKQLQESALEERYQTLSRTLSGKQVDGKAVLHALGALRAELDEFYAGLPRARQRIWEGSHALGSRIGDFRGLLAKALDRRDRSAHASQAEPPRLLRKLADEILAMKPGPNRRALEDRFEALSLLHERMQNFVPEVGASDQVVLENVLQFLRNLRRNLETAAIRTNEITLSVKRQRVLLLKFEALIKNLEATEELTKTIDQISAASAPSFGKLAEHMGEITSGLLQYTDRMSRKAEEATSRLAVDRPKGKKQMTPDELARRIRAASSHEDRSTIRNFIPARK